MLAIPALDNTLGALFIGVVSGALLLGISITQAYLYYDAFSKDTLFLKLSVAIILIFDSVHQALITHVVYTYLISEYMNPLFLDKYLWSLSAQSIFETLTMVTVQAFFCVRIWALSGHNYLFVALPAILTLANLGLGIAYTTVNVPEVSITLAFTRWLPLSRAINGMSAGTDIVIAVFMVYLLYQSRTGIASTESLLNKLMMYSISTGAVTSLTSIVTVILSVAFGPGNFIYGALYFITGRLYLNSMLASLNARQALRKGMNPSVNMSEFSSSRTGTNTQVCNPVFASNQDAKGSFGVESKDTVVMIKRGVDVHADHV
ncbi:hypothetical protein DL96DRAFT_1604984 [Flagelloscypha sp. PMI_526]|nr:hypothetical protein DL96DRAFT_1604984 [Flagelloscypha sp. PMI_526]